MEIGVSRTEATSEYRGLELICMFWKSKRAKGARRTLSILRPREGPVQQSAVSKAE